MPITQPKEDVVPRLFKAMQTGPEGLTTRREVVITNGAPDHSDEGGGE